MVVIPSGAAYPGSPTSAAFALVGVEERRSRGTCSSPEVEGCRCPRACPEPAEGFASLFWTLTWDCRIVTRVGPRLGQTKAEPGAPGSLIWLINLVVIFGCHQFWLSSRAEPRIRGPRQAPVLRWLGWRSGGVEGPAVRRKWKDARARISARRPGAPGFRDFRNLGLMSDLANNT